MKIERCRTPEQAGWLDLCLVNWPPTSPLENDLSDAVHLALGFTETERVVYCRRTLP